MNENTTKEKLEVSDAKINYLNKSLPEQIKKQLIEEIIVRVVIMAECMLWEHYETTKGGNKQ